MNYSSLDIANTCLQKYKYVCIDKLKPEVPDSADLHFGSAMHMGLQALIEGESVEAAEQAFTEYWISIRDKGLQYGRNDWSALQQLAGTFLKRFNDRHLKYIVPHSVEQRLFSKYKAIALEGTPDCVGEYKGVPSIIDFKTAGSEYPKEKIIVNPQMYLYAYLAHKELGYDATRLVYIVFIKGEKRIQTIMHAMQPGEIGLHLEQIRMQCEDLQKREEFPRNTRSCIQGSFKCPFFDKCWGEK